MHCKNCGAEIHDTVSGWECPNCGDEFIIADDSSLLASGISNSARVCPVCNQQMVQSLNPGVYRCRQCGYGESTLPYCVPYTHQFNDKSTTLPKHERIYDTPVETPSIAQPSHVQYGWVCPQCGRSLAPHVDSCPCRSKTEISWCSSMSNKTDVKID